MAIDMQELQDEYLSHIESHLQQSGGFEINDDAAADWAIRKIAQAQQRIEARKRFVEAELQRLADWKQAMDAKDQQTIDYMTGLLHRYFERLRESGVLGKSKTYVLPHGRLQARSVGPKWRKVDEQALARWAEQRGLVRTKIEPAWADIAKSLRPAADHIGAPALFVDPETGELVEVPGVALEAPPGERFTVAPELEVE